MTAAPDNQRHSGEQQESGVSGLPLALLIREGGDEDTYLASVQLQNGETVVLELDDGRTIAFHFGELLARAA